MVAAVSNLELAQLRFTQALERLEKAAESAAAGASGSVSQHADLAAELIAVRADRDRLASELETLRSSYDSMKTLTQAVAVRLDGTIARVRGALDS